MIILQEYHKNPIFWAVGQLDKDENAALLRMPACQSLHELERLRHPQRRLEWIHVRLLTFELLKKLGLPQVDIKKNEQGKPFLENLKMGISFSHTLDYVALALNLSGEIGIDIEVSNERIERIAHRVFDEAELALFPSSQNRTEIWCAKEAIYKLDSEKGLDFQKQILIRKSENQNLLGFLKKGNSIQKIKIETARHEPLQIVWVTPQVCFREGEI